MYTLCLTVHDYKVTASFLDYYLEGKWVVLYVGKYSTCHNVWYEDCAL